MKTVYTASREAEAVWVCQRLQQAGLRATVVGTVLSHAVPEIPFFHAYPEVKVHDEDFEAANELLAKWREQAVKSSAKVPAEPWACPECGERLEGQFTACWNCGQPRPSA